MPQSAFTHRLLLATSLACSVLTGCTTTEVADPVISHDLRQASVVSTSAPEFQPRAGDTVAWADHITVHAPEGVPVPQEIVDGLKDRIDQQLVSKGYRFAPAGQAATYQIHGLMVLGNQLNESQLRDILGFEPGMVAREQEYQKGSLLLMLVDPSTRLTDWRSVVQVFTSQELTTEQQTSRFDYIVRSLLRPLPDLNQPRS